MKYFVKRAYRKIRVIWSFLKKKNRILLSFSDYWSLRNFRPDFKGEMDLRFNRKVIVINSPFWFLHSLDEIFNLEVYRFSSSESCPVILDCGANIGLSVMYFKSLYPGAKITAFEADPNVFHLLETNLRPYGFDNINLVQAAVWHSAGTLDFYCEGSIGGKISSHASDARRVVSVPSIRLKDELTGPVDFLKLDIEGAEFEVLVDCARELSNVNTLFVEYHSVTKQPQKLHAILEIITGAGFRYYIKQAWDNVKHPFVDKKGRSFDLQLNIFCYRE